MSKLTVSLDEQTFTVELDSHLQPGRQMTVRVNGAPVTITLPDPGVLPDKIEWVMVEGRPYEVVYDPDLRWLRAYGGLHQLEVRDLETTIARPQSNDGRVKAPIPGLIARVLVSIGQAVEAGMPVAVLEAMKMENEINATMTGRVVAIHATPGQTVARNEGLVEIA